MINNFETPLDYQINKTYKNINVKMINIRELSQGGPLVGNITINNLLFNGVFGGPFFINEEYVFLSIYQKGVWQSGFYLCTINLKDYTINRFGKKKGVICVDRVENDKIWYYENLNKTKMNFYTLK